MGNGLIFPYHRVGVISDGGTKEGRPTRRWSSWVKPVGGSLRQIRGAVNSER